MPQISVIVPVYKVEAYLDRCVQSILQQTYTDFELIAVDDGSPDRCGPMCDEWAARDSRIRVIHKENGGLSDARNAGIDWAFAHSDSRWLFFVDSDDLLHPEALQRLLEAAIEFDVDISIGGFAETSGDLPAVEQSALQPRLWETRAFFMQKNNLDAIVAWGKLYRKELFAQIRYPVGKIHEDEYTTYKLLFACEKVAVITAALYGYYINPNGITKSEWSPKRMDILDALQERLRFFRKRGDRELVEQTARVYAGCAARQVDQAVRFPKAQKQIRAKLRRLLLRSPGSFSRSEDYWLWYAAFPRISSRVRGLFGRSR